MRVRMIRFGGIWREPLRVGQIVDAPDELAKAMIADGRAVPVATERTIEVAVAKPPRNAAKRTGKAK